MANELYNYSRIQLLVEELGQSEAARRCGVFPLTIVRAARGENTSIKTLRKIEQGLGIPICEMIECRHLLSTDKITDLRR